MDYFTAGLITVLILLFVEMRLASKWSAFYFKKGIRIYSKEIDYVNNHKNLDPTKKIT